MRYTSCISDHYYSSKHSVNLIGGDVFKFVCQFITISVTGSWLQGFARLRDLPVITWSIYMS